MDFFSILIALISIFTVFFDAEEQIAFCINPPFARMLSWALLACLMICIPIIIVRLKSFFLKQVKYIMPLFLILLGKLFVVFIISPDAYSQPYFLNVSKRFMIDFLLIFSVFSLAHSLKQIRISIFFYGLSVSLVILMIIKCAPDQIGLRQSIFDGFRIAGSIWNIAIISFLGVGWYLILFLTDSNLKFLLRLASGVFLLIIFLGGIFGLSRALIVSSFISLLYFALLRKSKKTWVVLSFIICLFLVFAFVPSSSAFNRIGQRLLETRIMEETRIYVWGDYYKNLSDFILFGCGPSGYRHYSYHFLGPHSVWLNYLVQFGIFSLIAFLWLIFGVFKEVKKIKAPLKRHCLFSWIVFYLIVASLYETGFNTLSAFWGIAVAFALSNIYTYHHSAIIIRSKRIK